MDIKKIMEKINSFANEKDKKIYTEIPEGWKVDTGALTAPCGTQWIHDCGSIIQRTRKTALLLDKWVIKELEKVGMKNE